MPRRPKTRLERLSDIASLLRRARSEAQHVGNQPLYDEIEHLCNRLVDVLQTEAKAALSLNNDELRARQDS